METVEREFVAALTPVERRRRRYELHAWRDGHAEMLGVMGGPRMCLTPIGGSVSVAIGADGTTRTGGVQRCGSPWVCPVCAPVVRERRAAEVDAAVSEWMRRGGDAWFVTLTVPHHRYESLRECWDRVQRMWAWAFTGRGRAVRRTVSRHEIRAVEVTYGRNGWHVHLHVLFLSDAGRFSVRRVVDRWRDAFKGEGVARFIPRVAVDCRQVELLDRGTADLAAYLAKVEGGWGCGLELVRGDLKSSSVGPAQLLELAAATADDGDARWLAPWIEFERVSKGRRALIWSQGLRDELGLGHEATDEEAAAGDEVVPVALWLVPSELWVSWRRAGLLGVLLERLVYCDAPAGCVRVPVRSP